MSTRDKIVAAARCWIGTPFAHQGRRLGIGLDCVGLPIMVGEELGLRDIKGELITSQTYRVYTSQPVGTYVHDVLAQHLVTKTLNGVLPGDVFSMKMPSAPCHVAIYVGLVAGVPHIIHAYNGGLLQCVEHPLDKHWRDRIAGTFTYPNID